MQMGWGAGLMPVIIAQGGGTRSVNAAFDIVLWLGVTIGMMGLCSFLLYLAKRHAKADRDVAPGGKANRLDTYRRMRDEGMISKAEYAAIRNKLAAEAKRNLDRPPEPGPSEF